MKTKFLLADDNLEKLEAIKSLINENFDNIEIYTSNSYNSTIKKAKLGNYDLLILDMSMPTFDQKEGTSAPIKSLAGKDVLSKLKYKKSTLKVIVVTQFDIFGRMSDTIDLQDLENSLVESYPDNFVGTVYFDPRSSSWGDKLLELIKKVIDFE